jgi:hypothetical protein
MNMFTQIVVTFLSGGLGAGIVTFVLNSETNVIGVELDCYDPKYRQKYLRLCDEAQHFKKAIVQLSRSHTLLSWTY